MTARTTVQTDSAPAAIGPYSQAVAHAGLVYCSGQIALDPASGELIEGGVVEQTHRVLQNLTAVLEAADSGLAHVLKTTVFVKDMRDFGRINEVYATYFGEAPPARAITASEGREPEPTQRAATQRH